MDTCKCAACGVEKPAADFYANDKKCKPCRRAMVKQARQLNMDAAREYDRKRANRPDRVAARKAYAATTQGQQARRRASSRWAADNARQRAAHVAVSNAVRDGILVKQPCAICGRGDVEGHHPDYDARLDVVWLCVDHHKQLHAEFEAAA